MNGGKIGTQSPQNSSNIDNTQTPAPVVTSKNLSKIKKVALVAIAMFAGAAAGAGITALSIATITVLPIVAGALVGAAVGIGGSNCPQN